jgi:hypothetical protein
VNLLLQGFLGGMPVTKIKARNKEKILKKWVQEKELLQKN